MKLEVGKAYLDGAGQRHHITRKDDHYYYTQDGGFFWEGGLYWSDGTPSKLDLVSEVSPSEVVETPFCIDIDGVPTPVPQVLSFRDQLARDILVADVQSGSEVVDAQAVRNCFDLADVFIAEAKLRG